MRKVQTEITLHPRSIVIRLDRDTEEFIGMTVISELHHEGREHRHDQAFTPDQLSEELLTHIQAIIGALETNGS